MTITIARAGRAHARTLLAGLALAFSLSGCQTPYGHDFSLGGYSDTRIDDNHYVVHFEGNTSTTPDRVWYYWIHRCAELTVEKGFEYFDLTTIDPKAYADHRVPDYIGWLAPTFEPSPRITPQALTQTQGPPRRDAVQRDGDLGTWQTVGDLTIRYREIHWWEKTALVSMYAESKLPQAHYVLHARTVLEDLGPYVHSGGDKPAPARRDVFRHSVRRVDISGHFAPMLDSDGKAGAGLAS